MTFYLTVSRNWCTCFVTLEGVILIFLKDLKTKLCKLNQKEFESMHYIKVYSKGVSKKRFCLLFHIAWLLYHYTQCLRSYYFEVCVSYQIKSRLFFLGQNVHLRMRFVARRVTKRTWKQKHTHTHKKTYKKQLLVSGENSAV